MKSYKKFFGDCDRDMGGLFLMAAMATGIGIIAWELIVPLVRVFVQ